MRGTLIQRSRCSHPPLSHWSAMRINSNEKRTHGTGGIRFRLTTFMLLAMLAFPAIAMGQSPTADQYNEVPPPPSTGGGDPSGLGGNVGPLPFTGFDVIAMLAVALAVTGIGLALQRAVARESTEEL
jgi:hypothetical protein